jgi:hypothetical protein
MKTTVRKSCRLQTNAFIIRKYQSKAKAKTNWQKNTINRRGHDQTDITKKKKTINGSGLSTNFRRIQPTQFIFVMFTLSMLLLN